MAFCTHMYMYIYLSSDKVLDVTVVSGRYSQSDSIFLLTSNGIVSTDICTYQAPNSVVFNQNLIGSDESKEQYEKNNHQEVRFLWAYRMYVYRFE